MTQKHYSAMLLNHKISRSITLCKLLPLKHSKVYQIEIPKQKPYLFIPLRMDLGGETLKLEKFST